MNPSSSFLDIVEPSSSTTTRIPPTTIRPRKGRLISLNADDEDSSQQPASVVPIPPRTSPHSRVTTPSPYTSRRASPLPVRHPSLGTDPGSRARNREDYLTGGPGSEGNVSTMRTTNAGFAAGFLDFSWSSLHSLASSVLGSNTASGTGTITTQRRKPSRSNFDVGNLPKPTALSSWGPATPTPQATAGTKEERHALVQAKKREVLLLANGDSVSDLKGRYKRRNSEEACDQNTVDPGHNDDALVYVHHVQPSDSITGITIKYGCQPAIFRKANGFWPSDSIQSRSTVLLPVEACSVKGRRMSSTGDQDLLRDSIPSPDSSEDLCGSSIVPIPVSTSDHSLDNETSTPNGGDRHWKHEAWVRIEGFPEAVEIGRVPRRTLGYFPRTRRKSHSPPYHVYDTTPTGPDTPQKQRRSVSSSLLFSHDSPNSSCSLPTSRDGSRTRTTGAGLSNASAGRRHRRKRSSISLSGPGGVGTLDQDVMAPGPAPDSLNRFIAEHLPTLAVSSPSMNIRKASFESTSTVVSGGSKTGLDSVGSAIEGWVRKMAIRAKAGLGELQQSAQGQQGHGVERAFGLSGLGDLIELNDGLEGTAPAIKTVGLQKYSGMTRSRSNLRGSESSFLRERFPSPAASTTGRARTAGPNMEE